jgi:hypothetical protein
MFRAISAIPPPNRFVKVGAVAWLKLTVTGTEGPTDGDTLTKTTFIQGRTSGGRSVDGLRFASGRPASRRSCRRPATFLR